MVHSPAPPSVQCFLLLHLLFLGYWSDHPPPVYLSQLVGLPQLSSSWSDNGRHCPCSRTPSYWGPPCSVCIRTPGPPIQWTTLYQRSLSRLSPLCLFHGLPMLACPCCPCPSNRTTTMPSRHPRYASFLPGLPQLPSPCPPLELNFIWVWPFLCSAETGELLVNTVSGPWHNVIFH